MTAMSPILPDQLGRLTVRQLLCLCLEREPGRRSVTVSDLVAMEESEAKHWRGEM